MYLYCCHTAAAPAAALDLMPIEVCVRVLCYVCHYVCSAASWQAGINRPEQPAAFALSAESEVRLSIVNVTCYQHDVGM
jgi:hypothetical protein